MNFTSDKKSSNEAECLVVKYDKQKQSSYFPMELLNSSDESSTNSEEEYVLNEDGYNVPLTPFNMNEELKEGYFDDEGTYHWTKQKNIIHDNWVENVDWNSAHPYRPKVENNVNNSTDSYAGDGFCRIGTYKKILTYLKPKETVTKALCRLGGKNMTTSERWKLKKLGKDIDFNVYDRQKVTELTALVDCVFIKTGNADIYQETYEGLIEKIKELETPFNKSKEQISFAAKQNSFELDMYCDDFEKKEKLLLKVAAADCNN